MLVVPITNLQEQEFAERMRTIAQRRQCSPAIVEAAVDEAMRAYKASNGRATVAQTALLVFLSEAQHGTIVRAIESSVPAPAKPAHVPAARTPFWWAEHPLFIVGFGLVVGALLTARVFGWLP